jgi:hypothetical protein
VKGQFGGGAPVLQNVWQYGVKGTRLQHQQGGQASLGGGSLLQQHVN